MTNGLTNQCRKYNRRSLDQWYSVANSLNVDFGGCTGGMISRPGRGEVNDPDKHPVSLQV